MNYRAEVCSKTQKKHFMYTQLIKAEITLGSGVRANNNDMQVAAVEATLSCNKWR